MLVVLGNHLLEQLQDVVATVKIVVRSLQSSGERHLTTSCRQHTVKMRRTRRTAAPLFQQRTKACCNGNLAVNKLEKAISRLGRRQSFKIRTAEILNERNRGNERPEKGRDFPIIQEAEGREGCPRQGFSHQTAKHVILYCRNFSDARHALRDNQGRLPDYKQLVATPTGFKKVTR